MMTIITMTSNLWQNDDIQGWNCLHRTLVSSWTGRTFIHVSYTRVYIYSYTLMCKSIHTNICYIYITHKYQSNTINRNTWDRNSTNMEVWFAGHMNQHWCLWVIKIFPIVIIKQVDNWIFNNLYSMFWRFEWWPNYSHLLIAGIIMTALTSL